MIKKFLRKVFRGTATANEPSSARTYTAAEHGLHPEQFSSHSRKICKTLQDSGAAAYVVGGAVRDLLLNKVPKDFDIATNATPEQIRQLFRRSRIIGRRFQIVHVMSGNDTIEVTTFRGGEPVKATNTDGRILHDNVFGTHPEDALRRDFTINALYYDPQQNTIIDFYHGMKDVRAGILCMIGDPATRYREDPVRMLRAIRLSAKLGLAIDPATKAPIAELADLLKDVPPARLFDEMLKLFFCGNAMAALNALREAGLHHGVLPLLDILLEVPEDREFISLALANTDERIRQGKTVSPGFLFATLLWRQLQKLTAQRHADGETLAAAMHGAMDNIIEQQGVELAITKRIAGDMKDIWSLQNRFERRSPKYAYRLLEAPRYRAGWDFLKIRAEAGEVLMALVNWWHEFAHASNEQGQQLLLEAANAPGSDNPTRPRRRRRRKKPATDAGASSGEPI